LWLCGPVPTTSSSGGKTYNGKLFKHCNKWLRWAFIEAAWIAIRVDGSLGALYQRKRGAGKKPALAIVCVARRLARITWQLLTQKRDFATRTPAKKTKTSLLNQGRPPRKQVRPRGGFHWPHPQKWPTEAKPTFPSRSLNCMIGHGILADPDGASWDRLEGWGSNCVTMNGGPLERPAS